MDQFHINFHIFAELPKFYIIFTFIILSEIGYYFSK